MVRADLPDLDVLDTEALKALILAHHQERQRHLEALAQQREEHQAERLSHTQQIERLKLVVEKLRRMLFGRKSEKLSMQLDQLELQLEEMESIQTAIRSAAAQPTLPETVDAAKPARKPLPDHLPRETVAHKSEHSCCPECGGGLRHFGEDVSEQLEYVPDSFRVIRHVRPKFACGKCETVVEAPAPSRPIARGLAAPGLLAHVLVSKYADHCVSRRRQQPYRCRRTKQEMRVGPSVAAIRSRHQTTACCCR